MLITHKGVFKMGEEYQDITTQTEGAQVMKWVSPSQLNNLPGCDLDEP
jgi:hypothetical protein